MNAFLIDYWQIWTVICMALLFIVGVPFLFYFELTLRSQSVYLKLKLFQWTLFESSEIQLNAMSQSKEPSDIQSASPKKQEPSTWKIRLLRTVIDKEFLFKFTGWNKKGFIHFLKLWRVKPSEIHLEYQTLDPLLIPKISSLFILIQSSVLPWEGANLRVLYGPTDFYFRINVQLRAFIFQFISLGFKQVIRFPFVCFLKNWKSSKVPKVLPWEEQLIQFIAKEIS